MNGIANENKNAGAQDWKITRPAGNNEIEGFASATSVFQGESIKFYVRTKMPKYSMAFYRMGWYNADGGRLMLTVPDLSSIEQPEPEVNELNKVECFWNVSYELIIPKDWCTGVYLCKLSSAPELFERYIIFSVKKEQNTATTYLFPIAVNTYQAYNTWGGFSLYGSRGALLTGLFDAIKYRARTVSFNRPYDDGFGSGQFLYFEYQLLRWMESKGFDISYSADQDLHSDNTLLSQSSAFICAGHSEYWTKEMYDHVEYALENYNIGVAFMGANAVYWQIRYEDSYNGKNRNIICYKCNRYVEFKEDPLFEINPALTTTYFKHPNIKRSEQSLVGQMYLGCLLDYGKNEKGEDIIKPIENQDLIFPENTHWLFENTGINKGEKFPKLLGYEFDKVWAQYPKPDNLMLLSRSPVKWFTSSDKSQKSYSSSTIYSKSNGNAVFSTGTMSWSWALDNYGHEYQVQVSEKIQKLTENIFKFISKQDTRQLTSGIVNSNALNYEEDFCEPDDTQLEFYSRVELEALPLNNEVKVQLKVTSIPDYNSRISKSKVAVYFFISGGIIGLAIGYMVFEREIAGLITGIAIGSIIGLLVDKLRAA